MRKNMFPYHVMELRGLACILLVAYHVVGIPRVSTFFIKKLRRLGFPFLVVSTLFYLLQTHAPGANGTSAPDSMWRIYVFSYAHFWYLQALFLIFTVVALLDALHTMDRSGGFALAMAAAVVACLTVHVDSNILSVNEACFLLPHFLLGVGVTRFRAMVPRQAMLGAAAAALAIGVALHQASLSGHLPQFGWNSGVALLCGIGGRGEAAACDAAEPGFPDGGCLPPMPSICATPCSPPVRGWFCTGWMRRTA